MKVIVFFANIIINKLLIKWDPSTWQCVYGCVSPWLESCVRKGRKYREYSIKVKCSCTTSVCFLLKQQHADAGSHQLLSITPRIVNIAKNPSRNKPHIKPAHSSAPEKPHTPTTMRTESRRPRADSSAGGGQGWVHHNHPRDWGTHMGSSEDEPGPGLTPRRSRAAATCWTGMRGLGTLLWTLPCQRTSTRDKASLRPACTCE